MKKYLKPNILFPSLLFLIILVICFQNYHPGTWLSGWDTLHPEFNFGLYLKRTFFGVWQEHQGLGAVAAQSHVGDLPRMLIYYPLSFFLSENFLRWSYFFLCLIAGPMGVYFLLKHITKKSWVGFCSGLVYLLNLGTLQQFYLPLEMFATHFATLPWLFLFALRFLEDGTGKAIMIFSLVTLIATPVSHTATLFYVYFLSICIFLISNVIVFKKRWGKAFLIFFATIAINSFWLLPNLYFVINHGQEVIDSKIHSQLFNRAYYTGKEFANIQDASLIKGYLFDWGRFDFSQKSFVDLFSEWKNHLSNPLVKILGYLVFINVLFGIGVSFFKKNKTAIVFFPLFLLSFLAIAIDLEFLSSVNILSEALRFHFTKFSILLMLMFALYFGFALEFLESKFKKSAIFVAIVTISLIYYMFPVFSGNLISKSEKVSFPPEYFQAFNYLNKQNLGRIAAFPMHTFWSWSYYNWDYEGAGFLWFGLKSPLLDREFDRWSPYNENFYWESSYAVYSKNLKLLETVLDKYQVQWLFVDESIFDPSSSKSVYLDELENMISSSLKITKDQSFGKIKLYKVSLKAPLNNFVFLKKNLPSIGPNYKWTNLDRAFMDNGDYISSDTGLIYYPFRSLFTGRAQSDLEFSLEDKGEHFVFSKVLSRELSDYYMEVPKINEKDLEWVDPKDLAKFKNLPRDIFFDGKKVEVSIPKVGGLYSSEINPGNEKEFFLQNLPHNLSYLISVESKNISGKPLNFWIENLNSRRADLETYLPSSRGEPSANTTSYFIQPPMEKDGLGYKLHFDDIQFGNENSQNELGKIKVYPIPFDFLTGLVLRKANVPKVENEISASVYHPNPSFYSVALPSINLDNQTLILSQSFENGWRAYEGNIFGRALQHVLVNNWQNGWVLDNSLAGKKIVIIFLPQYLEFIGGGLGLIFFVLIFLAFRKTR